MEIINRLQDIFKIHYRHNNILLINADCMEVMRYILDKEIDLVICDPPYGIGKDGQTKSTGGNGGRKAHEFKGWDSSIPEPEYFKELFRLSKNQVIWGANYMTPYLPPSMGWIFWDKGQRINQSDGELAFTSFEKALRVFEINRVELLKEGTIHPTQKPIKLYEWILTSYAKPGQLILDTHLGSGSNAIAAHNFKASFIGVEIDCDYFQSSVERFIKSTRQTTMFELTDLCKPIQENIFTKI